MALCDVSHATRVLTIFLCLNASVVSPNVLLVHMKKFHAIPPVTGNARRAIQSLTRGLGTALEAKQKMSLLWHVKRAMSQVAQPERTCFVRKSQQRQPQLRPQQSRFRGVYQRLLIRKIIIVMSMNTITILGLTGSANFLFSFLSGTS